MADPQPEALDLAALEASFSQPGALQCCCGNTNCDFLRHNCSVLDSVERDVHTAARLGKALLARHEALMASAETERFEMQSRIDQLETDKRSLEAENARTIQENRALLDQLESLNTSVIDSEIQIKTLEASLQSTQQTIRRLEAAELRASELEAQLGIMETEQAELQGTLVTTQAEARSAMQRWRKAEKGISDLQEKLERIEREAREERDRHAQMMARMEKQRAMEKDLNTAAGRLKGAAAAKTIGDGKNGGPVVSHFVRDLLSDNANLQLGIAELREMLMNSNDEIQHLREQLMFHQPAGDEGVAGWAGTLRAELAPDEFDPNSPRSPRLSQNPESAAPVSQELHIHHHYHVARPAEPKKPLKKKRQGLAPNIYTPARPFSPSGPSSPGPWRFPHGPTSPRLVGHSAKDSISTIRSNRWSVFSDQPSDFAPSSVPTSPMSHHRRVSLFDQDCESPVSPTTSVEPASPGWTKHHRPHNLDAGTRTFSTPRPLYLGDVPEDEPHRGSVDFQRGLRTTGRAEDGGPVMDVPQQRPSLTVTTSPDTPANLSAGGVLSMPTTPSFDDSFIAPRQRLRRATSRESIMSLSGGLDIHTLKSRPGQLALRPLGCSVSAETEVSAVVARPTIAKGNMGGKRGSLVLRDNLLSLPTLMVSAETPSGTEAGAPIQRSPSASGLGRIVSWRPWGGKNNTNVTAEQVSSDTSTLVPSDRARSLSPKSDSPSTESPGSSTMDITRANSSEAPARGPKKKSPPKEAVVSPRNFGINQPGAIPGFTAFWAAHQQRGPPTQVVPQNVDTEALREGLEEHSGL